ncbi:MAG: tetratricopeptide repeat protein [Acidobacteriota bacterium]
MTDADRAYRIFSGAIELPDAERLAYLDRACGDDAALRAEVESLLRADRAACGFLESGAASNPLQEAVDAADPLLGRTIGRYRVDAVIARGGMGVVYRATQEKPHREVALKLIAHGMTSAEMRKRFEVEAQVLGRLQHPGIAQIIEAGTTDLGFGPQPYFAMERIDGLLLSRHAEEHELGTAERLRLLIKVCEAVQHAHRKGVIHRDLKPANILVDAIGQPKVLDFGVARCTDPELQATRAETSEGQMVGTLSYMSPEQVRGVPGEVDTRTDVYSLGVIGYELLTGALPHDLEGCSFTAAARKVAEEAPRSLRAAGRAYPSDLETILGKALATDRERRYGSPSDLAADLQRFLENRPIEARPPSALYQARKLVARNRLAASLTGLVLVLLAALAGAMAVQANRIRVERDRAEAEAAAAHQVADFLQEVFQLPAPAQAQGETVTAREILDRGAERISTELEDQPQLQTRLMVLMGGVYEGLGLLDDAEPLLEDAVERVGAGSVTPEVRVEAEKGLAWLRRAQGRYEEGLEHAATAERIALAELDPEGEGTAQAVQTVGVLARDLGRLDLAEEKLLRAGEMLTALHGPDDESVGENLYHQAWLSFRKEEYSLALERSGRACGILEAAGPLHPKLALCLADQASILGASGEHDRAIEVMQRAIGIWDAILPADHPSRASAIDNLGTLYWRQGDLEAAAREYERGRAIRIRALGPRHVDVASSTYNLALAYRNQGRLDKAEPLFREALDVYDETVGPGHPSAVRARLTYAYLLRVTGRRDRALAAYDLMIEAMDDVPGLKLAEAHYARGMTLLELRRWADAQADLEAAREMTAALEGPDDPRLAGVRNGLGRVHLRQGMVDEAEADHRRALEILTAGGRAGGLEAGKAHQGLARVARRRGNDAEALRQLDRALAIFTGVRGADHRDALYLQAVAGAWAGKEAAAATTLRRAVEAGYDPSIVDVELDLAPIAGRADVQRLLQRGGERED